MFVNHIFSTGAMLPPVKPGVLYEYVMAGNGVFVRARRPGLEATIIAAEIAGQVRGLYPIPITLSLGSKVPAKLLAGMVVESYRAGQREKLFYLKPEPWRVYLPEQVAGAASVRPADPFAPEMAEALIEVHSHHVMRPFFSGQDNRDESTGFRIYTVIGDLGGRCPAILTRVGIYGHFCNIPSSWVYEMPVGLNDAYQEDDHERD